MKVYNQYETAQLIDALQSGKAEIIYAREDKTGFTYLTVKHRLPMPGLEDIPQLENVATI